MVRRSRVCRLLAVWLLLPLAGALSLSTLGGVKSSYAPSSLRDAWSFLQLGAGLINRRRLPFIPEFIPVDPSAIHTVSASDIHRFRKADEAMRSELMALQSQQKALRAVEALE